MTLRRVFFAGYVALAIVAAAPLHAQQLGGGGGVDIPIWRVLAALVVCAMAGLFVALALRGRSGQQLNRLKWLGQFARVGRIRLVESRRIASQAELSVVQCDGREYVVLSGQGYAQVIENRELPPENPARQV